MSKITRYYKDTQNAIEQIDACIELLCMENGRCTPSEVLALCRINATNEMYQVVVNRAEMHEYTVKKSGKGHTILDEIYDFPPHDGTIE